MKKSLLLAGAVLSVGMLSGCAGYGHFTSDAAGAGLWYADTTKGVSVGTGSGSKRGEASTMSILGLVSTGDAGIAKAAENGGIKKIGHVDIKFMHILGIYGKTTTVVYGE